MSDNLVEHLLAEFNPAFPKRVLLWLMVIPPQDGFRSQTAASRNLAPARFVDHVHVAIEESVNLAFESSPVSPAAAAVAVDPEFLHERRQGWSKNQLAVLGLDGLGTNPCQKQAGEISEWELVVSTGNHDELVRDFLEFVLQPVPWISAR